MNETQSVCERCQAWMLELTGSPDQVAPEELAAHLSQCAECRSEQEALSKTTQMLGELAPVDPPRHFFVYEESAGKPGWREWWRALLSPQSVALSSGLAALLLIAAFVLQLQVRTDGASLTVGVGTLPPLAQPRLERDPELLRADFQQLLTEELTARDRQVLETLRREISDFSAQWESTQEKRIDQILTNLDDRLGQQFRESDAALSENLRAAALTIYRTLSAEQRQDLQNLNARLELIEATDQVQGTQTRALLDTVWQLAQRQD